MIKKVFEQTLWQIIGKIVTAVSTIITLGLVTRNYGESGTGIYTLVLTYLAFFYLAADLGLNSYILPYFKEDQKQGNLLFNTRFYWSLILVLIADLITLFLPFRNHEFILAVFIGSFSIIFSGIVNSANLVFQNSLRYDKSIIASSFGSLISLPFVFYLAYLRVPVYFLMIAPLLSLIANNLTIFFIIKPHFIFKLERPNFNFLIATMKIAWPVSLTLILNTVYFRVDSFILASVRSFSEVGVYNLAYSIFQNTLVIPTFIMNAFYPILLYNLKHSKSTFVGQIKLGFLGMLGLSIIGLFLTWLSAPLIIQILSKQGFEGSITSLRILSLSFPAFFLSSLLMWIALSLKQYKKMLFVYAAGLAVNVGLNVYFIPTYGYIAASWNTVASEYLILILLTIILISSFKNIYATNN